MLVVATCWEYIISPGSSAALLLTSFYTCAQKFVCASVMMRHSVIPSSTEDLMLLLSRVNMYTQRVPDLEV